MNYIYISKWKMKDVKYAGYRALPQKIKNKRIKQAEQSQKNRAPNPQGILQFHQLSFFDFYVEENHNKIKLETYRHNYSKDANLKGLIFMFHGLNSHIGHGAHLAQIFSQKGYTTVGYDYRGFGRSQGKGGYVQSLDKHISEALYFVKAISKFPEYQNIPKFALGLSMGGMTVYHLSLRYPQLFKGVILMAPAMMHSLSSGLVSMARVIGKIIPDKMGLFKPVYGRATRNPQITDDVKKDLYAFSDRLVHSTMQMLVNVMENTPETFPQYGSPFMIIQGGLDKLVNPEVAFQMYDKSKTSIEDKEILFYEEMWHDIWHQPEIFQIMEKIIKWIDRWANVKQEARGIKQNEQAYMEQRSMEQKREKIESKVDEIEQIKLKVQEVNIEETKKQQEQQEQHKQQEQQQQHKQQQQEQHKQQQNDPKQQ